MAANADKEGMQKLPILDGPDTWDHWDFRMQGKFAKENLLMYFKDT